MSAGPYVTHEELMDMLAGDEWPLRVLNDRSRHLATHDAWRNISPRFEAAERPRFAAPAHVPPSLALTGWRPPEVGWRLRAGANR